MRLLFVADGRSPTTLNWLRHWVERGDEVFLVSTHPCAPSLNLAGIEVLPVAFSGMGASAGAWPAGKNVLRSSRTLGLRLVLRNWLGPLTLPKSARRLQAILARVQPDLVHALRIPFEGMLAAEAAGKRPLVVSVWGNDFTLHALSSPLMRHYTSRTLQAADALHADCQRDVRLARQWGLPEGVPTLVVPGGGGIRLDEIEAAARGAGEFPEELPPGDLVVNPRGQRPGSLRQDVFFQAIPGVLKKIPAALFVCPPLAGDAEAEHWVDALGVRSRVRLWPRLEQKQLWSLLHRAQVYVSPSLHDGTPNSLLEAMACGCFPVVGKVESLCEWLRHGENGLLVDPSDPQALAEAIVSALRDPRLRAEAAQQNASILSTRAEYGRCMEAVEAFYRGIL